MPLFLGFSCLSLSCLLQKNYCMLLAYKHKNLFFTEAIKSKIKILKDSVSRKCLNSYVVASHHVLRQGKV